MLNICAKFHWISPLSTEIWRHAKQLIMDDCRPAGRTDGRSDNTLPPPPILKHSVAQIQLKINDKRKLKSVINMRKRPSARECIVQWERCYVCSGVSVKKICARATKNVSNAGDVCSSDPWIGRTGQTTYWWRSATINGYDRRLPVMSAS